MEFGKKQAASLGGGTIRYVFASITTDAHVALLGMAHESLQHAQTRAVFTNQSRGFIGEDLLVGVRFQELANPEAAGVAPGLSGRQGVVGADHLVAVGHMGSRPQKQGSVTGHVFQEPVIAVGHDLHVLRGDLVGHGEHLIIGVAKNHRAIVPPRGACGFRRGQDVEQTIDFREGRVRELG